MTKCWIHGQTDEKKSTKPLKSHPGWPDRKKEFQQNLEIVLAPDRKTWEEKIKNLEIKEKKLEEKEQNFAKKYKKNSWEEVNQLIDDTLEENDKLKSNINAILNKWSASDLIILSNNIQTIVDKREQYKNERDLARQEVTQKDNRIFQLEKLFRGNALVFQKQLNYTENLKTQLEKEKNEKNITQDQANHLQRDIERLEDEKKELNQRIKELGDNSDEIKKERDRELQEAKDQVSTLTTQLNNTINIDNQVYDILSKHSNQTGLLPRTQEVINKFDTVISERDNRPNITLNQWNNDYSRRPTLATLNNIQSQFNSSQTQLNSARLQLNRELGWWDKWFNDNIDEPSQRSIAFSGVSQAIFSPYQPLTFKIIRRTDIDEAYVSARIGNIGIGAKLERQAKEIFKAVIYGYYRDK